LEQEGVTEEMAISFARGEANVLLQFVQIPVPGKDASYAVP